MKHTQFKHSLILLLTAIIWGTSFVAQSSGLQYIGPFTFSAIRIMMGALVLVPFVLIEYRSNKKIFKEHNEDMKPMYKRSIKYGVILGLLLFVAGNLQQIGMLEASAGKAGFITAFYIVLVPVFSIFLKKKTGILTWISVMIALVGLYFLCIGRHGDFKLSTFDISLLLCAAVFAVHILVVDSATKTSGLVMSMVQFITASIVSIPFIFLIDTPVLKMPPTMEHIGIAFFALCYSGIMSCGVAYTLQIFGQKGVNPTLASLIMSMESVTSVISGFLILNQKMKADEIIGCVLMFAAVILAQLPFGNGQEKDQDTVSK